MDLDELLERWREAGLLTASQADAIRAYEGPRTGGTRPALPRPEIATLLPDVDLRTLGTVLAGLALLALLGNIFAVATDLFLGPGQQVATEVEDIFHLVASVLGLFGGLRLASGQIAGRGLVYWSLGINIVSTLMLEGTRLRQPMTLGAIAVWLALLLLTWRARYRGRHRVF